MLQSCIESHSWQPAAAAALHTGTPGLPCAPSPAPECSSCLLQVTVTRDGATQQISVYDLLVGDVMQVETGDILAADGVLFKGNNVRQVQSLPFTSAGFPTVLCFETRARHQWARNQSSHHCCCLLTGAKCLCGREQLLAHAAAG